MTPRWHILFGAIFSLVILLVTPNIGWFNIILIFLASFLIDFDHYICAVFKSGKFSLFEAFRYHEEIDKVEEKKREKGIMEKGELHFFHTIEFHVLIGLLGFYWIGFFYIFLGMVFHSLIDLYSLFYSKEIYRREFFFVNWVWRRISKRD